MVGQYANKESIFQTKLIFTLKYNNGDSSLTMINHSYFIQLKTNNLSLSRTVINRGSFHYIVFS